VLWFTVQRASSEGKACRDYDILTVDGTALFTARAFNWGRDITVQVAGNPARPSVLIRRRRSFPITGKIDVYELPGHARIGILVRSGKFHDASGRTAGRFQDARGAGDRAKEGLAVGVLDAVFGGDATVSEISRPSGFVYTVNDARVGTLTRAKPPFLSSPQREVSGRAQTIRNWLPKRIGDALFAPPASTGWKLERTHLPPGEDPRICVMAALFTIEISHW
jgi:hypothetical protein